MILVVAACAVLTLYAITRPGTAPDHGAAASALDVAPSVPDSADALLICSVPGTLCGSAQVPGTAPVSYAVLRAHGPSAGLILMEPGGPGANALARTDRDSLGLPAQLDSYDVLLVNEPWVGTRATRQCQHAMGEFVNAVAAASQPSPLTLATSCAVQAWTHQSYIAALKAILAKLERPLAGIVGHSYGALPAAAAAAEWPQAWLILNAPIAPPGAAGPVVMAQRLESVSLALDRSYQSHCTVLGLNCQAAGHNVAATAISRVTSVQVPGRARPLAKGDFAVALLGAMYGLSENGRWLWTVISSISSLDTVTRAQVARMADQMLMRFGDNQISEQLTGFVVGTCGAYSRWSPSNDTATPAIDTFLSHVAFQCAATAPASPHWTTAQPNRSQGSTCIFANRSDPVTAPSWADSWAHLLDTQAIALATYTYEGHASLSTALKHTKHHECMPLKG